MDFLSNLLASEQLLTLLLAFFGGVLTFVINRAAAAFTLATGIQIEAQHREVLHEAIKSGVESALRYGPKMAVGTMKVHVVQHLRASVPDALKALTPGDGVLDRLIDRYVLETLNKFGEPK